MKKPDPTSLKRRRGLLHKGLAVVSTEVGRIHDSTELAEV